MYGPMMLKKAALKGPRARCSSKVTPGTLRRSQRRVRRGNTSMSALGAVPGGDLGAGPKAQPQADPFDVALGRALVDAQARRDLAVRAPLADQLRHLPLASGQPVGAAPGDGPAE